jgi:hypothetical protein
MSLSKKIFIGLGAFLLLIAGSLFAIPYFFKDQIKAKIEQTLNDNLNANVSFKDADLSLIKNFPNATIGLNQFLIINKAPFEGDTLVSLGELNLRMSVKELFKGKTEPINITSVYAKDGVVNVLYNLDGIANYDIALKNDMPEDKKDETATDPMNLKIQNYKIENFKIRYYDEASKINMVMNKLNHEGTGDFEASQLDLVTTSDTELSLDMDKVKYMNQIKIKLDATLGMDLEKSKFVFKENKAFINQLPLELDGFIQMLDNGQTYDLKFKTPTTSFKNFLALIPEAYAASIENVKTTGEFTVDGIVKGTYTETTIPQLNIEIKSNNASFQYPDLPKSVQNIVIDTKIINTTGLLNDTYVDINQFSFKIDQDVFSTKAKIQNIATNPMVDAKLKGSVNLANISKAYPVQLEKPLTGIFKADVTTHFDMQSVEKSQYQNIKNAGVMSLSGFKYTDENNQSIDIATALVQFNTSQINLKQFDAKTGKSDISVNGVLDNFYGFMFKNQELRGNFNLSSNQLAVADFMTTSETPAKTETETTTKAEPMKIPAFLNCTLNTTAKKVLYDNLILQNVSGKMTIKDEKVILDNIKSDIFGGNVGFNGSVSTKGTKPVFDMNLSLAAVDVSQTFTQLEMLKKIAPIASVITGKINSTIKLNGNLTDELTPDLKTLSGDLLGQLLSSSIDTKNSTLLTALSSNIKFFDANKLNLNDIKAALSFKDGKVNVKPFDIKYQDITATVGGSHGFDQNMNYTMKFDVPAKYLGTEANAMLAKLSPSEASQIKSIPINAIIGGDFTSPKITTDIKSATVNLTKQLVAQQKDKLVSKGTTALSGLIDKNKKPGDTTKTTIPTTKEEIKEKVKEEAKAKAGNLLKGLLNKGK